MFGGDITWTGNANDGIWSTGANWSNNSGPGTGDSAVFNSSGGTITVNVTANYQMQNIRVLGSADVVVNIADGVVLSCSNGGSLGIQANGADLTINGPGKLAMSSTGSGLNHLDNGASLGRTLAIHAEIIGFNGGLTGFEAWLASTATRGGDIILGYTANAFTLDMNANMHTIIVSKLAPAGQPSCLGAINNIMPSRGGTIRYTGTGDTAGYAFRLSGGDANLGFGGGIMQDGTGPLLWTGNIYNENNAVQTLTLSGDSASPGTITGNIYNNQGTLAVVKNGSGTWVLKGDNSFTGGLTVNAGTLGLDSPTAHGNVSQITMAPGATLAVNPSATANFTATLPPINASGAGAVAITTSAPGTLVFISGFPTGPVGSWLTFNGGPAQYDPVNGLTPTTLTPVTGIKTKGDTLPDGADITAVIDTLGTVGFIALPADPTTLYSLTLTANDDATVATAGKTLMAGEVAIAAGANALTIGAAPQDGLLLPPLPLSSLPVIPDNTSVAALAPVIWYDPSDPLAVTVVGGAVNGLANKGSGGSALDAVVRGGWTGPLYVTNTALPMVRVNSNTQGLQSAANTGISGNNPRTLIAVMTRDSGKQGMISMGSGSTRSVFEIYPYSDTVVRLGLYNDDLDFNTPVVPDTPYVLVFQNGAGGNLNVTQGFSDGAASPTRTAGGDDGITTSNTPLHLGHRNGTHNDNYRFLFGEVLLFDRTLDTIERQTVEAYLLAKWKRTLLTDVPQHATLTLRNDSGAPLTVNAALADPFGSAVSLVKAGPGDVTLAGGTVFSGTARIDEGALTLVPPLGVIDTLYGVISGPGKLIKSGDGILYLPYSAANTYAGGTDILGGTVIVGNNRSFGTGPVTIADGATLDIGGGISLSTLAITNRIFVSGTGVDGLGAIVNNGVLDQSQAFQNTVVTLMDHTAFGGTGARWDLRTGATLDLNGFTLDKIGAADLRLFNGSGGFSNAPAGTAVHIHQGTLAVESNNFHPNTGDQNIIIEGGARFGLYNYTTPINWSITANDGANIWAYGTTYSTNVHILAGDITVDGTLHLTANGANLHKNITGQILGTGGISVHDGNDSAMSLLSHPANTFTGPVAVSNATLGLLYPGSLPTGSPLSLASNTATGVRVFAGADRWTGPEIAALANSGVFNSTVHRFGIVVGQDENASLGTIASGFAATLDKYGPGTLAYDGNVGPLLSNSRAFGGNLIFTNNATFDIGGGTQGLLLKDGNDWDNADRPIYALVGGNATITSTDLGYNNGNGPFVGVGYNGKAVLDLKDNAFIQAKIYVGQNNASAVGAVYQSGGTFLSTGGAGNDGHIGHNGYGYYQLDDGDFTMKGYTQLGSANSTSGIGILRQTGGTMTFNGMREEPLAAKGTVTNSYGGQLGLSRGGKAVLHLEGGTFDHYGPLSIIDNNASGNNIAATMTVTGTADVFVDRSIFIGHGNAGLASLNLNGGTLAAPQILRKDVTGSRVAVNFNGGLLRVADSPMLGGALLAREGNTAADFHAYVYPGGARIEVADGLTRSVDIPLEQPADSGIASIAVTGGGSGYIAPPYVTISGGDNNATAIATINRTTGQLTGIEITNPGTRYNISTPTVSFTGGGGTGATAGAITRTGNSGGGLTKTGGGTLILNAPNTYTGPTVVEAGTLALAHPDALHPDSEVIIHDGTLDLYGNTVTLRSVTITGSGGIVNGKVITSSAVKTGPGTATWDVDIEFAAVGEPLIPGLWEGGIKGNNNLWWDLTAPNPKTSIQLTTRAGNIPGPTAPNNGSSDIIPGTDLPVSYFWNGSYWTWIYSGYLWNRADTNVTWTWRLRFDDRSGISIDGTLLTATTASDNTRTANYTLTPGPHAIDIRYADSGGGVGSSEAGSKGGVAYDPLGRGNVNIDNFILLEDDGTGFLLTANLPPAEPDSAVRVLEGTLKMPSSAGRDPGLWEGGIKGTSNTDFWNLTAPNPATSVQLSTRAGSLPMGQNNTPPRDEFWNGSFWTWIYTGYIWNRSGTNETWSWRAGFDDRVRLTVDGNHLISTENSGHFFIVNYLMTPGAHPIEIRFADSGGGVGAVSSWPSGVMYDRLGRESANSADYLALEDDNTGFLLTTTLRDNAPTDFSDVVFDIADGAAIDFANTPRDGMIISPSGDDHTGTMSIDGMFNGSLNGVIYNVTVHDPVPTVTPIVNTPGLWEGIVTYPSGFWDPLVPNPVTSPNPVLTTRAGNVIVGNYNDGPRAEFWSSQWATWVYTGYIWNNESTNVTWTFRFSFDDNVVLILDNRYDGYIPLSAQIQYRNYTLTPGPHPIEIRFNNTGGAVGAANNSGVLGGLMYDPLGRGSTDANDYILLQDDGTGTLLTTTGYVPGTSDTQVCDVITATGILNLNGLTIKPSDVLSATPPSGKYVIAIADGFIGKPVLEGFAPKWKTIHNGNELWLTTQGGTMLILR